MNDVCWGQLDYLLIDTPPGTSDEHLAVMENIRSLNFENFGAILVTTPQVKNINNILSNFIRKTFCVVNFTIFFIKILQLKLNISNLIAIQ